MAKQIFRKGTPLTVIWSLTKPDGTAMDLAGYRCRLYYATGNRESEATSTVVSANNISWVFAAAKQTIAGDYRMKLRLYQNGGLFCEINYEDAFTLFEGTAETASVQSQEAYNNIVNLHTVAEYYLLQPVVPVVGDDLYWYVNGVKLVDSLGQYVSAEHTVDYDQTTHYIIIDKDRVDAQGKSIAQTITAIAEALKDIADEEDALERAEGQGDYSDPDEYPDTRRAKEAERQENEASRQRAEGDSNSVPGDGSRVGNELQRIADEGRPSDEEGANTRWGAEKARRAAEGTPDDDPADPYVNTRWAQFKRAIIATLRANKAAEAAEHQVDVKRGYGIAEVTEPVVSNQPGGRNTIRLRTEDNRSYDVYVYNGRDSHGLFADAAALAAAKPNPAVGDYAFVGSAFPADIYVCVTAGTWEDSGNDYGGPTGFELVDRLDSDDPTKALSAKQGKTLDGKISQLGQKANVLDNECLTRVDKASSIVWEDNFYLRSNGTKSSTTADNKIGYIEGVENYAYVKLRASIKAGGGSFDKTPYCFVGTDNHVVQAGPTISPDVNYDTGIICVAVPIGAFKIVISWDNTLDGESPVVEFIGSSKAEKPLLSDSLPFEVGKAYGGGTTVGTSTMPTAPSIRESYACTKIQVQEGDIYRLKGNGGMQIRLWYIYDSAGILVRVADALAYEQFPDVLLTIGSGEHWLVANVYIAYSYYLRDARLQNTVREISNNLLTTDTILHNVEQIVTDYIDLSQAINWTTGRFIQSTGVLKSTTATNKVGTVDIRGYRKIKFNWSVKNGGNYEKLGWMIVNEAGIILYKSDNIASTTAITGTVELSLSRYAYMLYISANTSLNEAQVCIVDNSIDKRIMSLEWHLDDIEKSEINIENKGVRAYMNVRYDNADYSYTKFPYAIAGAGTPNYEYPNQYVIDTPVDDNAVSRTLELADNASFSDKRTIALDLVSSTYAVTNLEGNKLYYYRVYLNSDTSLIVSYGTFMTKGQLRNLFVQADSTVFGAAYIDNVRDLGGWKTCDGKRLRYGCIIRGNELNHLSDGTMETYISQDGINELLTLGVLAELDLRGGDYDASALGQDIAYANIPVDLAFYRLNIYNYPVLRLSQFKSCLQQIITWLSAGKGIYIHCQGGCDRTGFLAALIEGICGVSENDINHDYELSNRDRSREYYTIAGGSDYDGDFKFAIEYIKGLLEYNGNIYVYYRGNYYDPTAPVTNYTPVPISDPTLLAALNALPFGTFKQCWRRLMKIGGVDMSERDMDRLEQLLCS